MRFSYLLKSDPYEEVQKFNHRHDPSTGRFASRSDANGMRTTTVRDKNTGEKTTLTHHKDMTSYSGDRGATENRNHGDASRGSQKEAVALANKQRGAVHKEAGSIAGQLSGLGDRNNITSKSHVSQITPRDGETKNVTVNHHEVKPASRSPSDLQAARNSLDAAHLHELVHSYLTGNKATLEKSVIPMGDATTGRHGPSKSINQKASTRTMDANKAGFPNTKSIHEALSNCSVIIKKGRNGQPDKTMNAADHAIIGADGTVKIHIPDKSTAHGRALNVLTKAISNKLGAGQDFEHSNREIVKADAVRAKLAQHLTPEQMTQLDGHRDRLMAKQKKNDAKAAKQRATRAANRQSATT